MGDFLEIGLQHTVTTTGNSRVPVDVRTGFVTEEMTEVIPEPQLLRMVATVVAVVIGVVTYAGTKESHACHEVHLRHKAGVGIDVIQLFVHVRQLVLDKFPIRCTEVSPYTGTKLNRFVCGIKT